MSGPELDDDEYLLYELIRHHEKQGQSLPKTQFNKLAYIIKKELEDRDIHVPLPVYWYEHGKVIDEDEITNYFYDFQRANYDTTPGYKATLTTELSPSDFEISPEKRHAIDQTVEEVSERYKDVYDTTVAKDETYQKYADNDFIVHLNEFRYLLNDLEDGGSISADEYAPTDVSIGDIVPSERSSHQSDTNDIDDEELLEGLTTLVATFPEDKYDHMAEEFYEWESITRQLIYNEMYGQLDTFTNEFWNAFSKAELRLHHYEDISRGKLVQWRRDRDEYIEEFQERLDHYRGVMLKHRDSSDVFDSVSEEYDEAVEETYREYREQRQ